MVKQRINSEVFIVLRGTTFVIKRAESRRKSTSSAFETPPRRQCLSVELRKLASYFRNYWKKSYLALVRAAFNIERRNTKTKGIRHSSQSHRT